MWKLLFLFSAVTLSLAAIDIIGYYGNSGNAVSSIPTFDKIHPNYNVVIITFASIDSSGTVTIDIQGPYEKDLDLMTKDIQTWKQTADPLGRTRSCLVSIGGQNGQWPSTLDPLTITNGLSAFMAKFNLDGLDIDLEGGAVSSASSLVPVIKSLLAKGKIVTAAPEAAQGPLDGYKDILSLLTWVHPQFYNNGPNAVTTPYVPPNWPSPWTVSDWQAELNGTAFWAGVLDAIAVADNFSQAQKGMLIPATPAGAGSYNHWDIAKLATEVKAAGVTHVGTWAIAYDNQNNYEFAVTMGKL